MTATVWALDALSGAPNYTGVMLRNATVAPFAGVAPVGFPLGVRSGVRPGTPSTTAFLSGASNLTWNVAAHAGIIQAESSATAGPYAYWTDGSDTGSVNAANATYARVDILYFQVNDTVQDSSGLESGTVGYLAGTASATPVAPPTPVRSMVLAQISVPASGGGNPSLSWKCPSFADHPACEAYQSSPQSAATGVTVAVALQTALINNDGIWSSGNNTQFVIVTPGTYLVSGQVTFSANASGLRAAGIGLNGTPYSVVSSSYFTPPSAGVAAVPIAVRRIHLNAGDYLQLNAYQTSGGNLTVSVGQAETFMSIERVGDM